MTLQDFFNAISANPAILIVLLLAVPLATLIVNMWSGSTAEQVLKWKYVYAALAYLACVPGIFALTLNVYLFLFERQSIFQFDVYTQILPFFVMLLTLWLIRRNVSFDYIPGFGKISGLVLMIFATISVMWIVDRTRIVVFSYLRFEYVLVLFLGLLCLMMLGWRRFFG